MPQSITQFFSSQLAKVQSWMAIYKSLPILHRVGIGGLSLLLLLLTFWQIGTSANVDKSVELSSQGGNNGESIAITLPLLDGSSEATALWYSKIVQEGDSLSVLLEKIGVGQSTLKQLYQLDKFYLSQLSRLKVGDVIDFELSPDNKLLAIRYKVDKETSTEISRNAIDAFVGEMISLPKSVEYHYVEGEINGSFYMSAKRQHMSDKSIMNLANTFAYDIDFVLDIRKGDKFKAVYEKVFVNGEYVGDGSIIAAEFFVRDKTFTALRYEDSKGEVNYYTPDGRGVRKDFLRTPVDFTRISSKFNPNRKHPLFKTKRPHKGVDYAAPTGTPIYAAGSGTVEFVGKKSGYGNVIYLRHSPKIQTRYAHMSRFVSTLKKGQRVKQGQRIGYVGQTGYATGPHLHYEFRLSGKAKDPLKVTKAVTKKLPAAELKRFNGEAKHLLAMLVDKHGVIVAGR